MIITGLGLLYCVIAIVIGILLCHSCDPYDTNQEIIIGLSMIFWPIFIAVLCVAVLTLAFSKLAEFLLERVL